MSSAMPLVPLALVILVPTLIAQEGTSVPAPGGGSPTVVQASFQNFGNGCASSGWQYATDIIVPQSLVSTFGNSNNNIPYSWNPTKYQQIFLGSEIGAAPVIMVGIGLRQDNQFSNFDGHTIDLEIAVGGSTFDHNTITATFASNFNSATFARTPAFTRRQFTLPKMPPGLPTNPAEFFITIPFDLPIPVALGQDNLVVESINWGNTAGNQLFTYPLDAGQGSVTTTRLYASGSPGATTGTLGRSYGMVYALKTLGGGGLPAIPHLYAGNRPVLNDTFRLALANGRLVTAGLLIISNNNTNFGSIPLPFDLTPIGAPGCSLLVSAGQVIVPFATQGGGDAVLALPLPGSAALDGAHVYFQALLIDTINALGLVMSDGGDAQLGFQ